MSNIKNNSKKIFVTIIFAALLLWLMLSNPENLSPALLLIPFALIFILLYNCIVWMIKSLSVAMHPRRRRAIGWFLSLIVDVLIVLSSLGELGVRDGAMLLAIAVLGLFYIFKLMSLDPSDNVLR